MWRVTALCLGLLAGSAASDASDRARLVEAWLEEPTDIYPHCILGELRESFVLAVRDADGREMRVDLREAQGPPSVFEDVAPRVVDADGDRSADIVVVESALHAGAQLAVYAIHRGRLTKIAATPYIGTPFRWLAPVAIADLDGDGRIDLAYVETPHLVPTLRVWNWAPGGLIERARLTGVTNHRIGEETISGGLRDCGDGPEMVLADRGWHRLVVVAYERGRLESRLLDGAPDSDGFSRALACQI